MNILPNVGAMLRSYIDKNKIAQSAWSRKAGVNETTIATYLKNPTMRLDTVYKISQTLGHNFIREIADTLPDNLPPEKTIDLSETVAVLEKRNAELSIDVATLKEAIKLMSGRG